MLTGPPLQPEPEPQGYNLKQVLKIDVYSRYLHSSASMWTCVICELWFIYWSNHTVTTHWPNHRLITYRPNHRVITQENLPNPVRHVRLLLLCPILRHRGGSVHRILTLSIPSCNLFFPFPFMWSAVEKHRQIQDGVGSPVTKFMILGYKVLQLKVPISEQGTRKE